MKKLVKTIAIAVLMALGTTTTFVQEVTASTGITPNVDTRWLYAFQPNSDMVKATATVTFYIQGGGSGFVVTVNGELVHVAGEQSYFQFWFSNMDMKITSIAYKVVCSNADDTTGYIAEGTFNNGQDWIIYSWDIKWDTVGPNNPGN